MGKIYACNAVLEALFILFWLDFLFFDSSR